MTLEKLKKEFNEIKEKLDKIENILNNASTGVDFYNACQEYYLCENGSPEQREAIINIFSSAFGFVEGKIPNWLGGCIVDQTNWFIDIISTDINDKIVNKRTFEIEAFYLYDNGIISTQEEYDNYIDGKFNMLEALREIKKINKFDKIFYDIGLIDPITGKIDITVYNNWEDVAKNYFEDVSAGAGVCTDEDIIDFFESTNAIDDSSKNVKKFIKAVAHTVSTARNTRYDPLILDLDGDGFNIETKENGTNFDLDKNGLAEKINWTRKDGILCLDLNGNGGKHTSNTIGINSHLFTYNGIRYA